MAIRKERFPTFRRLLPLLLIAGLILVNGMTGCRSPEERPAPMFQTAPPTLPAQGASPSPAGPNEPVVYFRGLFRNPVLTWSEDLTLAAGLVEAQYLGARDPFEITIIRDGRTHRIAAARLLRGIDNPLLLPGDIVAIHR